MLVTDAICRRHRRTITTLCIDRVRNSPFVNSKSANPRNLWDGVGTREINVWFTRQMEVTPKIGELLGTSLGSI